MNPLSKPTFQDILKLATLVIIRTVISYFLHKEIEDTMTDMEQQKKRTRDPKKLAGTLVLLFNRFKIMKWFVRQTLHFTFLSSIIAKISSEKFSKNNTAAFIGVCPPISATSLAVK